MRWTQGSVTLDVDAGHIVRDGREVSLTPLEAAFLRYMAEHPGEVVSEQVLLREVWGYHPQANTRAISRSLHRLRAKLERQPRQPEWLHTIRGQGYRFTPPPAAAHTAARRGPLLGREAEQQALSGWLGSGRLLTILGPGGMGKTRLAQWAADQATERLVGFCALDGSTSEARLLEQVGAVLSVPLPDTAAGAVAAIGEALSRRECPLLILDNLEQVVAHAAPLVARWLEDSDVQILVTSRQRLRLPGESVLLLGPLAPAPATALLAQVGGWREDTSLPALAAALEGIPLALLLAAAHGPLTPPPVVLAHLSALLAQPAATGPDRHRTMSAAVSGSWALLDAAQQSALALMSACGGPVSLSAAAAVLDRPGAIGLLLGLVERSMLRWEGELLTMYSVVRRFARAALSDADAAAALSRLGWYAARAGLAAREAAGIGRGDAALEAVVSMPSLLAAFEAALAARDATLACWTAYLVGQLRFGRIHPTQIRVDLARALALPGAAPDARARVQYVLARSAALVGDYGVASESFDAVLRYAAGTEPVMERLALCAIVQHQQPGRDRLADARRAVAACEGDEARLLPVALSLLGMVLHRQGQYEEAAVAYRRSERLFEAHNQTLGVIRILCLSASLPMSRAAQVGFAERLRSVGASPTDKTGILVWCVLGGVLLDIGEPEEARGYLETASAFHRCSGDLTDLMLILQNRGIAAMMVGEPEAACALLGEALQLAHDISAYQTPTVTAWMGVAHLMNGQPAAALPLLAGAPLGADWSTAFRVVARWRSGDATAADELARISDPALASLLTAPTPEALAAAAEWGRQGWLLAQALAQALAQGEVTRIVPSSKVLPVSSSSPDHHR